MDFNAKRNSKYIIPIVIAAIVLILGGSYAWYTFSKEGGENKIIAGSLYLTLNEGVDTISLESVFPETKEEARARNDNVITFTLSGKNTSTTKDINYEIKLMNGEDKANKERFNTKDLVFDLSEVGANNEETLILDAVSYNELNDKKIWVDKVLKNTTSEIEKTYKLRMWLSEDVIISDTSPNADYAATGEHSYKNYYATVKVAVEGDLTDKVMPLTIETNASMVRDGEVYFTNIIENANSTNSEDSYNLTITSSDTNVRFVYDPTDVSLTNINSENISIIARPLVDYDNDDIILNKVDNEIETTTSFNKTYTIQNNKKVTFDVTLVTVNNHATTTGLTFTLKKNNVVVQELVKHINVLGKSASVVVNVNNNISYTGNAIDLSGTVITNPDGTTYSGEVEYTYYSGSSCNGAALSSAPTDAGTYCVKITVPETANSEETVIERQIVIEKADRTITLDNNSGTYTGSAVPIEAPEGATVKYYTDSSCTQGETTTAPTYGTMYVKASMAATTNYNACESSCTEYTINAATPTVTIPELTNISYTGTSQSVQGATSVPDGGGTITYTYYTNSSCTSGETTTAPTNTGTYYVKATASGVSGKTTSATSSCTEYVIEKATPTVTLTPVTGVTYTGNSVPANPATVTLVNNETYSGTINYTYYTNDTCTEGATTTAPQTGVWYVKASIPASTNYSAAESGCIVHRIGTIENVTVTLTPKTGMIYDGTGKTPNAPTVTPATGGEVTYKYYTDSSCTQGETTTAPKVGSWYTKAIVGAASGVTITSSESNCVAHTIAPKEISATLTANDKVYDGTTTATLTGTATPTGLVSGDQVVVNTGSANCTFASANVGEDITVTCSGLTISGTNAANYTMASSITTTADITNVAITFNANTGTLSGTSPLYTRSGVNVFYTGLTNTTAGTLPTATKVGYFFAGWYTAATGGSLVINNSGVVQSSVTGWTDSNGNFILTSNDDLYAQFYEVWAVNLSYDNTNSPGIDCTGSNATAQCALDSIASMLGIEPAPICIRATTLRTEICNQSSSYCYADGYYLGGTMDTTTITYGNLGTSGNTPAVGDAFDCDVNGNGNYTERFYYVSPYYNTDTKTFDDTTGYATLIYYSNTVSGIANAGNSQYYSSSQNWYGPVSAKANLPTMSQWSNITLKNTERRILAEYGSTHNATSTSGGTLPTAFSYSGYAARLLTAQELMNGCDLTQVGSSTLGELSTKCKFLMDGTKYADSSKSASGPWLETPFASNSRSAWYVSPDSRNVYFGNANTSSSGGTRPAIDVPYSRLQY